MRKASKEAFAKNMKDKMGSICNVFLTKRDVLTHEAIQRVLSMSMRHSISDVVDIPTGVKKIE